MRGLRASILCGVAAALLVGLAGVAQARTPQRHTMSVTLPGGGVAEITYWGNVAPRVTLAPAPFAATRLALPFAEPGPSPLAAFRAINAEVNRAMANMMHEMRAAFAVPAWAFAPGGLTPAAFGALPPDVCSRSISITYSGNGAAPKVVRHSSGDCGAKAPMPGVRTAAPANSAAQPGTILVNDQVPAAHATAPALRPATYWRPIG